MSRLDTSRSPRSRCCACPACTASRASSGLCRRHFLAGPATGLTSAVLAGGGAGLLTGRPAHAQHPLGPDAALDRLMEGNARFVAHRLVSFDEDLSILRQNTATSQEPFAAVLSCADSRVPVELVFDQSIGHVFVTRVAGNFCTPEIIASLEYGAAVLGAAAIVVLGHAGCGAVKATIEAKSVPGQISALYAPIRPAVMRAGTNLDAVIKANALIQADLLRTASPVIAGLVGQGKAKVVAAYYDLASGKVSLLA